jgi:hypothetical protein
MTVRDFNTSSFSKQDRIIIFCTPQEFEKIANFKIDLFVNIASLGEMTISWIEYYFRLMRLSSGNKIFYNCNREEKILPGGEVTRFNLYPYQKSDVDLVAQEECPWHQELYSLKPPFIRKYDGKILHRLTRLSSL